jgi:F-type H+-transporting ATPase subunit delta
MRTEAAAKRYAQAAFAVALEQGELERWTADLESLAALMTQPDAAAVLESDRVADAEKEKLLTAALADVGPRALNLARLLVAKRRTALAVQIGQEFQTLLDEHRGVARAAVTTAVPLSDEQAQGVAARLSRITGKQVSVEPRVDEAIMGGLIARVGDTLIDGSTRSRLIALKKELRGAAP